MNAFEESILYKMSRPGLLICVVGLLGATSCRSREKSIEKANQVFMRYFHLGLPESVTNIRIDQPGKFQGRTYAMRFGINRDDFTRLKESRSFVKIYKLEYEDGTLNWFWKSGEDNFLGMPTHGSSLPAYSQRRKPGWFKPNKFYSYESYAFEQIGNVVNPLLAEGINQVLLEGHTTILVLIYSEKEGEAYLVAMDYSH